MTITFMGKKVAQTLYIVTSLNKLNKVIFIFHCHLENKRQIFLHSQFFWLMMNRGFFKQKCSAQ